MKQIPFLVRMAPTIIVAIKAKTMTETAMAITEGGLRFQTSPFDICPGDGRTEVEMTASEMKPDENDEQTLKILHNFHANIIMLER